jgi:hypothetical protein
MKELWIQILNPWFFHFIDRHLVIVHDMLMVHCSLGCYVFEMTIWVRKL